MVRGSQKFDIVPRPLPRIGREENITDDRNGIGARFQDFSGPLQRDASDGHNWLVRQRPNPANQFDSNHWIRVGFGGRGEHRSDGDIISGRGSSFLELIQVVRRNAQQFPRPYHRTRCFRSQILLSDVDAARFRGRRDIGPVIHNKCDTLWNQQRRKPLRAFE